MRLCLLMKVALLSDCYPPRLGGIESQVHGLAGALAAAGHRVEVFTITRGPETDGDLPVHRLGLRRDLPGSLLMNPAAGRAARKLLDRGGFDVAHAHLGVVSPFAVDAIGAALAVGVPLAATWHSVTGRAEPVVRALGHPRRWARRGVALSAVSRLAAEPIQRVANAPVSLLPNGIDTSFWSPGEAERDADGELHVVSALRFAARKRPVQLVEFVREARKRSGRDIRLTIAGDGPLRRRLLDRRPPWCALPGRLSPEELRELYRNADLYAAPAVLEAFGIAAAEARSCGLPVITREQSAVADLVDDGRTGVLVAGDTEFAAELARLAANPSVREGLSRCSRADRVDLGWQRVRELVVGEYRRAQELTTTH